MIERMGTHETDGLVRTVVVHDALQDGGERRDTDASANENGMLRHENAS